MSQIWNSAWTWCPVYCFHFSLMTRQSLLSLAYSRIGRFSILIDNMDFFRLPYETDSTRYHPILLPLSFSSWLKTVFFRGCSRSVSSFFSQPGRKCYRWSTPCKLNLLRSWWSHLCITAVPPFFLSFCSIRETVYFVFQTETILTWPRGQAPLKSSA